LSEETVVGKRFTIVIPSSIRSRLSIKEGQRILMKQEGKRIELEPLPDDPYQTLREVIGSPYEEAKEAKKAEEWLRHRAGR